MKWLVVAISLAAASSAQAQAVGQEEFNRITGAPPGTRCFRSVVLAQGIVTGSIVTEVCPRQFKRPMEAEELHEALKALKAIDVDFLSDPCQVQMHLMFRTARGSLAKDRARVCELMTRELLNNPFFTPLMR